jgi:hypothetical protein
MKWVCDACGKEFEADKGRCPKCLRITTVRDANEPPPMSGAGPDQDAIDRFHTVKRLTLLGVSIVLAVPGIVTCLVLDKHLGALFWPLTFAAWAFAIMCIRVPRALDDDAYATWGRAVRSYAVTVAMVVVMAFAVAFGGSVAAWMLEPFGVVVQVLFGAAVAVALVVVLFKLVLTPERRQTVDRWTK